MNTALFCGTEVYLMSRVEDIRNLGTPVSQGNFSLT
jgi:hypothetical protein